MADEATFLDVKILGREYRVACPPGEQDALLAAVKLVDGKMQDIAHKTKNMVPERVAVMAALNIAHEHLQAPQAVTAVENAAVENAFDSEDAKRRIKVMDTRLDALLAQQELDI